MKSKFGFILVKPQLGENIGACARSIKNFGFSKLYVVNPKINFPNHKAKATSVGAFDIINKTKVFNKNHVHNSFGMQKITNAWGAGGSGIKEWLPKCKYLNSYYNKT